MKTNISTNSRKLAKSVNDSQFVAMISLTKAGHDLSKEIMTKAKKTNPQENFTFKVFSSYKSKQDQKKENQSDFDLRELLITNFIQSRPIIFIGALAIVARILAPFISNKKEEAGVIAISENGRTISLLLGADNYGYELSSYISKILSITEISGLGHSLSFNKTSPTRLQKGWYFNQKNAAIELASKQQIVQKLTYINPHLQKVVAPFKAKKISDKDCKNNDYDFSLSYKTIPFDNHVQDDDNQQSPKNNTIILHPPVLALGIGCVRGIDDQSLISFVVEALKKHNIAKESIIAISSLDLKANEVALQALSDFLKVRLVFFTKDEVNLYTKYCNNLSDVVFKSVGTPSVAEASAYCCLANSFDINNEQLTNNNLSFEVEKLTQPKASLAIVRSDVAVDITNLPGRKIGLLMVIGLGLDSQTMTIQAIKALSEVDYVIGYKNYVDRALRFSYQAQHKRYEIGQEQLRVEDAVNLAKLGYKVCILASGDPSIFALASLVYQTVIRSTDPFILALDIRIIAGLTSFLYASSKAGAIIGHDTAIISLSDLLTPKDVILARLQSAIDSDMIIALYNPISKKRRSILKKTIDMLSKKNKPNLPILIAKNLGENSEKIIVTNLKSFDINLIDMKTTIIIGNSYSKTAKLLANTIVYSPRGYILKS